MVISGFSVLSESRVDLLPERERNETIRVYGKVADADTVSLRNRSETKDGYNGKVALPTKNYIDNVIKDAFTNIKNGRNVDENRKIIKIFSNIIGENPLAGELKSYYV